MKFGFISLISGLMMFLSCNQSAENKEIESLRLCGWDYDWMNFVKNKLNSGDQYFLAAYEKLISDADEVLKEGVYSVTFKEKTPPSGSKHDYMSQGPYWWPDPDKPDGLPYINKDGVVNPERNELDSAPLSRMREGVRTTSMAWFFSGNIEYANKAAELLRVWFMDPETHMNPNLEYAQAIPGRVEGRGVGIIDTRSFYFLVDAIALLETSGVLTEEEKDDLNKWFEEYLRWVVESENGKDEDNASNNHSTANDVLVCAMAYYTGNDDFIQQKISEMPRRRIDTMIEKDGRQPKELSRTRSFHYSIFNLSNFIDAGEIGQRVGVDIFDYVNPDGGSIKEALDFLIGYIGKEKDWEYEHISNWEKNENNLGLLIRRAARIYDNSEYQLLWEDTFYERTKSNWQLLVHPGKKGPNDF